MTDEEKYRGSAFERHLQTGALLIGVGLMGWFGHTVEATNTNQAVLTTKAEQTGSAITELKNTLRDEMYRRSDAKRDVDATNQQISELRSRVSALESVLNARSRPASGPVADWSRK